MWAAEEEIAGVRIEDLWERRISERGEMGFEGKELVMR